MTYRSPRVHTSPAQRTRVQRSTSASGLVRLLLVLLAVPAVCLGALVAALLAALLGPAMALMLLVKRGLPVRAHNPRPKPVPAAFTA